MTPMTTQATRALTPAQRRDIALCTQALADTRVTPADRCQLALTEVRVALELALGIIGHLADGAS